MNTLNDKGAALLAFLKANATIRRKRVSSYGAGDEVLWFADIPRNCGECRSPFFFEILEDFTGLWLEVRKKRMPARPPVPQAVVDWVRPDALDQPDQEPELRTEIRVLVERRVPDPDAPDDVPGTIVETVPELHRLADHPEVEDAWLEYLIEKWEPWAHERRQWQEVQDVYESLDFMRRRLEEAEERYELVLAIGFLQWHDPTGTAVARHVLTAPTELTLDAARGLLSVTPAASFDTFRVELDMLELQHRPRLNEQTLGEQLEALDIQAWDTARIAPLLREIANSLSADAQVDETFDRADRTGEHPHLSFAPALVLRERRPTAYEDLLRKLHEVAIGGGLGTTRPWERLLGEGEASSGGANHPIAAPEDDPPVSADTDRFLFPLPTNEEQRQIVQRLQADPCVLVKGPPGTGKSHTIANLICHLLARGDRILVTAHAPKALAVLRGLLPDDIRDLCVTALGSSREDQRLLEESVRGVLRRKNEWRGPEAAQRAIDEAESTLDELEGALARVERDLRAFREAEMHSHELPGGYSGTAAQIARRLSEQEQEFDWFPQLSADAAYPLDPSESAFLTDALAYFTADVCAELSLEIGDTELPGPDEFQVLVAQLAAAEELAQRTSRGVEGAKLECLEPVGTEQLRQFREAVQALTDLGLRVGRVMGELLKTILQDLLASAEARWTRHAADSETLLKDAKCLLEAIDSARVELPDGIAEDHLRTDVERRLAHFTAGGWKGFSVFAPRVVRDTRYIAEGCLVDGKKAAEVEQLRCVYDYLELRRTVRELRDVWGASLAEISNPRQAVSRAEELTTELKALLGFFRSERAGSLATILGSERTALASAGQRDDWLKAVDAVLASRDARDAQYEFDLLLGIVRNLQPGLNAHPCVRSLEEAARTRDARAWRTAWQERERVRHEKRLLETYEGLLTKLDRSCPGLAVLLRDTGGEPTWRDRVSKLREAWDWAAARAWLRQVSNASAYEARVQEYHRLQQKSEKATETLVSNRAWKVFFDRLDEKTVQSLNAWTRAVDRIGKGTGKHANRHRRTARQYLMDCVPRIPAWVMPLHKLWDSVDAVPGLFDTVIVDEASQASVDALALLLLAKRIVVVGDEKQNSPEAVGVPEDDIARLAREHLSAFRFRDEFRPDTSLFDHSERTFGSHITLREHFRCVPEIIRFSNDLCYRDTPLIPLRQAPPERLPPLRSRFVAEGACKETGQRITNPAEAMALVETIVKLVDDEAFEAKTMGVIALQGHAQAQLIETLLAQKLEPRVIEERRLRCGEPATFQGDQRDVIFLSLVISPNVKYRALTRLPDQRRFNVAMSRARDQVWLFHSVRPHDLGPDDLRRRLVSFFESPQNAAVDALFEDLDALERKAKGPRRLGTQPDPYESWFEVDVALELLRRKFRIRPQVEAAGRRIDLVVEGFDARIAVECDGDNWHGLEQYEYDMVRQRQLERAGWTFARVRESDFYVDRQRAVNAVVETCEELGIRPVDFIEEPQREPSITPDHDRGSSSGVLPETVVATENPEKIAAEADVEPSIVGPFTGYSGASGFPDPRESAAANVREVLRRIIERDGPLTRSSVYRLYVEGCQDLRRVGRIVRQALNRTLGSMLRAGEIAQEDELRDGSPESQVLRIAGTPAVRVRPAGKRDLLEIPPSELLAALRRLPLEASQLHRDDEDVARALLGYYGFNRLTRPRREYLARVLRLLQQPDHGFGVQE
ncbi:MAG TPA: AAA domain-containing protein [Thermoanaerobaculaceae bacterium]|nr:AAA domain-containing protein [Thermoanaerobaculaceae bacterium]